MSDFFKRLKERGAKPIEPKKQENFLNAVRREVIPAIKEAEENQRSLTAEYRSRPIKRVSRKG